ncbi:peptidoglycan DD-metalloendopeptidase family protein [Elstera sp.]|jgi:murein DD-endopeptidase MepM/ murein hydrolase activator NlpD|uniref:peptidoglycan DD-metalloendopeptidase family protein n=1 Tax=Elstera sp. TaxID=1916664 RepID=UPI0037C0EAEB
MRILSRLMIGLGLIATALTGCGDKGFDQPEWAGGARPAALGRQGTQSSGIRASYVVQRGDTVYALAREFKVPVKTLIDVNDIQPPYQLLIGQRLSVPTEQIHMVAAGDTLYSVSRRYNVDTTALVRANDLREPFALKVGQHLVLPGTVAEANAEPAPPVPAPKPVTVVSRSGDVKVAALPPPPKPVAAPVAPVAAPPAVAVPSPPVPEAPPKTATPAPVQPTPVAPPAPPKAEPPKVEPPKPSDLAKPIEPPKPVLTPPPVKAEPPKPVPPKAEPAKADAEDAEVGEPATPLPAQEAPVKKPSRDEVVAALPTPPPRGGRSFQWPTTGRIIATFGPQDRGLHNDGINIAAAKGTPVRAAENGVVAYAGDEIRGFGNLLLIRHADGFMTAYAHNEVLLVNRGDTIRRGQVIARVGQTGNVSTPQLHFEIRKGTQAVDPEQYLGRPTASLPTRLTATEG